jgi:hypothetical protein
VAGDALVNAATAAFIDVYGRRAISGPRMEKAEVVTMVPFRLRSGAAACPTVRVVPSSTSFSTCTHRSSGDVEVLVADQARGDRHAVEPTEQLHRLGHRTRATGRGHVEDGGLRVAPAANTLHRIGGVPGRGPRV